MVSDDDLPGSPDHRNIDDITTAEYCDFCGWNPCAVILVDTGDDRHWECYNCGEDPDGGGPYEHGELI